jgi:hypothetical protein
VHKIARRSQGFGIGSVLEGKGSWSDTRGRRIGNCAAGSAVSERKSGACSSSKQREGREGAGALCCAGPIALV